MLFFQAIFNQAGVAGHILNSLQAQLWSSYCIYSGYKRWPNTSIEDVKV